MKRILLALSAVLAVLIGTVPAAADRRPAAAPAAFDPHKIKHLVVILKENHSFNSILGPFCARSPARGCRGDDIGTAEPTSTGVRVKLTPGPDIVPLTDHSLQAQTRIWHNGRNDRWDTIAGCEPSRKYKCYQAQEPRSIPNITALAKAYALNDHTLTCQRTASWSDKLTWTSACDQNGFVGVNPKARPGAPTHGGLGCESGKVAPWSDGGPVRLVPSCVPCRRATCGPNGGAFEPTPVKPQNDLLQECDAAPRCTWTNYNTARLWSVAAMRSYSVNVHVSNKQPSDFLTDARAGRLPSISYVTSNLDGDDSQHNGSSMLLGDNSIGKEVKAAMTGPDRLSTAIFLVWDDCGCQYDPVDPSRVANIIISPFARPGFTDHTHVSFASIQRLMERAFNLPAMNRNDAGAYDFAKAFNFSQKPIKLPRMVISNVPAASIEAAKHNPSANDDS